MEPEDLLESKSLCGSCFFEEKGQGSIQPFNLDVSQSPQELILGQGEKEQGNQSEISQLNQEAEASKGCWLIQSIKLGNLHNNIHRLVIRLIHEASKWNEDLHEVVLKAMKETRIQQGKIKSNEASISSIIVQIVRHGQDVEKLGQLILKFIDERHELSKAKIREQDIPKIKFFIQSKFFSACKSIERALASDPNMVFEPSLLKKMWRKRKSS